MNPLAPLPVSCHREPSGTDGMAEIIVNPSKLRLEILDGSNGQQDWMSGARELYNAPAVADLDDDGHYDICFCVVHLVGWQRERSRISDIANHFGKQNRGGMAL